MAEVQTADYNCRLDCAVITVAVLTLLEGLADVVFGFILEEANPCQRDDSSLYLRHCFFSGYWFGRTSISQGALSVVLATLLLIGVFKSTSYMLLTYIVLMTANALGYFVIGVCILREDGEEWGVLIRFYGIWLVCWSSVICCFVWVVRIYKKKMLQQNRKNLFSLYPLTTVPLNAAQLQLVSTSYPATVQPLNPQWVPGACLTPVSHQQNYNFHPSGAPSPISSYTVPLSNQSYGF